MIAQALPKNSVVITDHISDFAIARAVLGEALCSQLHSDIQVAVAWRHKVDADFIKAHPKLRGVVRYGAGFDNFDLEACTEHGIVACNNPTYGVDEVSDTAIAMIMALVRGITRYDVIAAQVPPTWQANVIPTIKRTRAMTLGIVGAGRIGSAALLKAKAIGFQTLIYDPYASPGIEKTYGSERVRTLEEIARRSDVLSFHVPLTPETTGMINGDLIAAMKPGSFLVSTARGKVVSDLKPLFDALRTQHLQGVGLDVLPEEPPVDMSVLQAWTARESWLEGRVIINPHTAYYSIESQEEMHRVAAENAGRILRNEIPDNVLNPEVLPRWKESLAVG